MGIDQREEEKAMLIDKKKKFVIQFQFPQIARKVKKSPRTKPVSLFLSVFLERVLKPSGALPLGEHCARH